MSYRPQGLRTEIVAASDALFARPDQGLAITDLAALTPTACALCWGPCRHDKLYCDECQVKRDEFAKTVRGLK